MVGYVLAHYEIAQMRLAIVWAARQARTVIDHAQVLAGTAGALDPAFDRAVRDFNVARHHLQLQDHIVEDVGRVMLGLQPQNPTF